ncbi:MAG: ABC transporter permease [Deltaproteobacteria bacterium]|nr:ABC transporter permease [Deltaproteobacteria bacterium]
MTLSNLFRESMRSLGGNKVRTFFMMAGTIVGIAALVLVMSIGKGTERKIMKKVETFGPHAIMVLTGGGKQLGPPNMNITTLTLEDANAIRQGIPNLKIVTSIARKLRMGLRAAGHEYQAMVWGVEPAFHDSYHWYVSSGEEFSDEDVATLARVCVIGETVRQQLFGDQDPVGQTIYVNKVRLRIKGLLTKRGRTPLGGDFDARILVPITTAMRRLLNVDYLGAIRIIAKSRTNLGKTVRAVEALLHRRHHITPPKEDDFRVLSSDRIQKMARRTARTLSILLLSLAVLSMLVGGVVLMNIMLISVGERQKEIGLRRAVGATKRQIGMQFLIEALSVTLIGMLIGGLLGAGITLLLGQYTRMPAVLSWESVGISVAFALLVGTIFGVQPARKAAASSPVDALR